MSGVAEVGLPIPAEYLVTGDKALIFGWATLTTTVGNTSDEAVAAVLCLEDGSSVHAPLGEFKFDYRYDNNRQKWVDVSRVPMEDGGEDMAIAGEFDREEDSADTNQEDADHGGPEVPGLLLDADGASPGDPGDR